MAFDAGAVTGEIVLRYNKAVKALTTVEQQTKRSMGRMTAYVQKHGAAFERVGRTMVIAGAAIGAALAVSVKRAASFEAAMRNANAIMRTSEEEFRNISLAVRKLSTELPQSADILAAGLYQIASGGIAAADSMDVLRASATAAVAGVSDTATAASALITVLNTYEMEASEASRVSDILFTTVEKGVLTFAQLSGSLGMVVSSARPAGISIEEVGAAMVVMTRSGFDASMASTALARIMETFLSPSKEFGDAIEDVTGKTAQLIIQEEGLIGAINAMSKAAQGNQAILAELGIEKRALRAAFALTRGEGELFNQMLLEHQNAFGATARAYREQAKAFAVQWDLMKSSINELLISIGEDLLPRLKEVIERVVEVTEIVTDWRNKNEELAASTTTASVKIAGLTVAAGGTAYAIAKLAGPIKAVLAFFAGPLGWVAVIGSAVASLVIFRKEINAFLDSILRIDRFTNRIEDGMYGAADAIDTAATASEQALRRFYPPDLQDLIGVTLPEDVANIRDEFEEATLAFVEFSASFTPGPEAGVQYEAMRTRIDTLAESFREAAIAVGLIGDEAEDSGEQVTAAGNATRKTRLEVSQEYQRWLQAEYDLARGIDAQLAAAQRYYEWVLVAIDKYRDSNDLAEREFAATLQVELDGNAARARSWEDVTNRVYELIEAEDARAKHALASAETIKLARREEEQTLIALSDRFEKVAEAIKETARDAEQASREAADVISPIWGNLADTISNRWGDAFVEMRREGGRFVDYMDGIWQAVLDTATRAIAQIVANWLFGIDQMMETGRIGGVFGDAVDAVTEAFAGGGDGEGAKQKAPAWVETLSRVGVAFLQASAVYAAATGDWRAAVLRFALSVLIQKVLEGMRTTSVAVETASAATMTVSAAAMATAAGIQAGAATGMVMAAGTMMTAAVMMAASKSVIPFLQEGGIVSQPMLAVVGDVPEAIIPLSKMDAMQGTRPKHALALAGADAGGGGTVFNFAPGAIQPLIGVDSLTEWDVRKLADRLLEAISERLDDVAMTDGLRRT